MNAQQKFHAYFAPELQEEHRPIILYRDTVNDMLTDCSSLLPHLPAEKRAVMTKTIEALADTFRFIDEMHSSYMQLPEDIRP